jgi:ABC-type multidrug transport system ATPase subunit
MGIGYLPQEASVFRKLSVEDNIKAVLEMTKLSRAEQKDKLEALLDEFHLHHVRKNNGDSLSGGERRRTEIARALAVEPKFMLLDEPFAGVDPIAVEDIQSVVARLKFRNIGILITDHNVNETLSICDRAYLLIDGKIFKHGTAEELAEDEQVRRLYLGRNFELKRKDYLHEEARQKEMNEFTRSEGPSREDIVISVKNAIEELENIARTRSERSQSALMTGGKYTLPSTTDRFNERDELGIDVFEKLIPEIKTAALRFAQDNHNQELMKVAERLTPDEEAARTDLNDLLLLLEADDS